MYQLFPNKNWRKELILKMNSALKLPIPMVMNLQLPELPSFKKLMSFEKKKQILSRQSWPKPKNKISIVILKCLRAKTEKVTTNQIVQKAEPKEWDLLQKVRKDHLAKVSRNHI